MKTASEDQSSAEQDRARKVAVASRMMEGLASGRFDYLDETTIEDVVFVIAGDRASCPVCGSFLGRPAVRDALRLLHVTWEYLDEPDPDSFIVDTDHVVFRQSSRWRSRGSGKMRRFECVCHAVFEGDRIKEYTLFLDTAALASFEEWN